MVTFLFQLGSFLEQKTMKKTRSAIKALTELAPTTARRIVGSGQDGDFETEEIDADQVEEGDLLLVRAGDQIPADGTVVRGEGYVAEAGITGVSGRAIRSMRGRCWTAARSSCGPPELGRTRPLPGSLRWWRKRRTPNPRRSA